MKKIVILESELKTIIASNWQNSIINLANYANLVTKNKTLKDEEYENQLFDTIRFLTVLKKELNITNILKIELQDILNKINEKCWKVSYFGWYGIGYNRYFDEKLQKIIINKYNKKIKFSNHKIKQEIISNYFKTKKEKNIYENWKTNYFRNINEKRINNRKDEKVIDTFEYFKDEINSTNLNKQIPTSITYQINLPKI